MRHDQQAAEMLPRFDIGSLPVMRKNFSMPDADIAMAKAVRESSSKIMLDHYRAFKLYKKLAKDYKF